MRTNNAQPATLAAATFLVFICTAPAQPAQAAGNDDSDRTIASRAEGPLIDVSFEQAMLKHFEKRFFGRISATDDQRAKLSSILENRMETSRPLREQMRHEVLAMTDIMAKDDATDAQITKQQQVIKSLRNQLADGRLQTMLQVREVLTPEQRHLISDKVHWLLSSAPSSHRLTGGMFPARAMIGQLMLDR